MSPRVAVIGLTAGILLAVGPAALWLLGRAGVGGAVAAPPSAASPAPAPVAPPIGARPPAGADGTGAVDAPTPPVRLRVVGVGVDAPVVDSGVDGRGRMAVPHDVGTVGWYRFGPNPGAPEGSVVLAGHVDDREQGRGAFHDLQDAEVGDPVEVVLADGRTLTYRVTGVERVAKDVLPVDRIFARDGPPRLALITCGGQFDRSAGAYADNVVVTAAGEPEGASVAR